MVLLTILNDIKVHVGPVAFITGDPSMYHWNEEYGGVPLTTVASKVQDSPTSKKTDVGVTSIVGGGFTISDTGLEKVTSPMESTALTYMLYVPAEAALKVQVDELAPAIATPFRYH